MFKTCKSKFRKYGPSGTARVVWINTATHQSCHAEFPFLASFGRCVSGVCFQNFLLVLGNVQIIAVISAVTAEWSNGCSNHLLEHLGRLWPSACYTIVRSLQRGLQSFKQNRHFSTAQNSSNLCFQNSSQFPAGAPRLIFLVGWRVISDMHRIRNTLVAASEVLQQKIIV